MCVCTCVYMCVTQERTQDTVFVHVCVHVWMDVFVHVHVCVGQFECHLIVAYSCTEGLDEFTRSQERGKMHTFCVLADS